MGVTATDIAQIPMSSDLAATLSRGAEFAGATGAADVSLEHLLAALCDDPDAIAVLDASQINGERLKADVIARVLAGAQQSHDPRDSLGVSQDVRRILEAAAAAARGSRRRDINGAIVLAAIVGDARSNAAEILEAHGLTFDNAIRALQSALAPPREAPPVQPPVADDVLARARERVQSRATPSLRDIMKDMPRPAPPAPAVPLPEVPSFEVSPEPSVALPEVAAAPERGREPTLQPAPQSPSLTDEEPLPELHIGPVEANALPPGPSQPFPSQPFPAQPTPQEPRLPTGGAPETQRRPDPSFGPITEASPSPASFPPEPSLPLPTRPVHQSPPTGPQQEANRFPAPAPARGGSVAPPPREIFVDLPPRPQPSRIQPPPIPPGAPGLGGPPGARPRGPLPPQGPAPSQMGPGVPPGTARVVPMGPQGQRPNPNQQDPAFRPGAPIGGPAPQRAAPQAQPRKKAKRAKDAPVEAGQLAENIPRTMRVGKTVRAEIRIAKASVKALTEGLDGGGQVWQHAVAVTKAMSVRIRAPDGGFYIESASPETQWIESNLGYASDDFASWRFLITPQWRGWSSLEIIVSARTIGADGVAAETALPDQIVDVKVRRNIGRSLARLFSWTVAAIIGGALATFGEVAMGPATALLKKFLH